MGLFDKIRGKGNQGGDEANKDLAKINSKTNVFERSSIE